ncbi:MAG: hypothetical protein MJH10_20105 [Epibacterium sp.]|nr:hypothetical protein [Epibacterium sp.]NQX75780.1 hypothetical protein [Epibacterium sp.]
MDIAFEMLRLSAPIFGVFAIYVLARFILFVIFSDTRGAPGKRPYPMVHKESE